ncbi:MAG: hypothetical protein R3296_02550 [Oleiphilaceae bacterium]|nr:hypothetical protein [Oleiphilaceae bacterium]
MITEEELEEKGAEAGRASAYKRVVSNLFQAGCDLALVARVTELPLEEVKRIKAELKKSTL